jgi:hypothetical protein
MPNRYTVSFYRDVVGGRGRPHPSPLGSYEVASAASGGDAIARAVKMFETHHRLGSWQSLADRYKIVSDDDLSWSGETDKAVPPETEWSPETP